MPMATGELGPTGAASDAVATALPTSKGLGQHPRGDAAVVKKPMGHAGGNQIAAGAPVPPVTSSEAQAATSLQAATLTNEAAAAQEIAGRNTAAEPPSGSPRYPRSSGATDVVSGRRTVSTAAAPESARPPPHPPRRYASGTAAATNEPSNESWLGSDAVLYCESTNGSQSGSMTGSTTTTAHPLSDAVNADQRYTRQFRGVFTPATGPTMYATRSDPNIRGATYVSTPASPPYSRESTFEDATGPSSSVIDSYILGRASSKRRKLYEQTWGRIVRRAFELLSNEAIQTISLCLLWYASSALSNNLAKQIFLVYHYPVTLTYVQFAFVAGCCFLFGYFAGDPQTQRRRESAGYGELPSFDARRGGAASGLARSYSFLSSPSLARPSWASGAPTGIWKKVVPSPLLRRLLAVLVFGMAWILTASFVLLHRGIETLRLWVAIGYEDACFHELFSRHQKYLSHSSLGIHDDHHHVHNRVRLFTGTRIRVPTRKVVETMLPLAGFLISGHVFSSVAISNVPVSFVHTVKALSPLFTVLAYRYVYNTVYPDRVYLSLLPLTLGVMLACGYDLAFNFLGLTCALASTAIFVAQNIFSKSLFKDGKLDKLNMLLYSSSSSFILMTVGEPIWFWSEGFDIVWGVTPLEYMSSSDSAAAAASSHKNYPTLSVAMLFVLNGLTHFCQNVFAFSILSLVTPVSYSIASLIKRIVVIVASIMWFSQPVSNVQAVGVMLTFLGLWLYRSAKMATDDGGLKNVSENSGVKAAGSSPTTEEVPLDVVLTAKSDAHRHRS